MAVIGRKSEISFLPEEEETDNFPVQIGGQGFNAFKDAIAHLETGGLLPGEKYVRTGYSAGRGSSAFGPYQINRDRVKEMLKDAGITTSISKGEPDINFGRSVVSFKYNKKRDKGVYSPEEVTSLQRLFDEQTEGLRIGGSDRGRLQKKFGFPEEYADAYDYSMPIGERRRELAANPNAPLRRGTYLLSDAELDGIRSASEKELRRHYDKHVGNKDAVEIAKMWHGGDAYKTKGDDPAKTDEYGQNFVEFIRKYNRRTGSELFDIGFQQGGLVDPRSGFDFVRAPQGAREEDYDLYETPAGNVFGVPQGTPQDQAALLGFQQYQDDYLSLFAPPEQEQEIGERDPGLLERFGGELAAAFREQMTSVPGAVQMTLGDILDDEELYRSGLANAEEASRKAAEYTPFQRIGIKSGEENIADTYREEGFFPAAYQGAEYVAQTLGQTVGYVAPAALARLGAGALASASLASLPITGTIAGMTLLGSAAFLTYSNLLSNQLERNAEVSRREGRDPSTEDFNIANQMIAAAGQTALETLVPAAVARGLPRGATGLGRKNLTEAVADAGANAAVRNASNTAAAQTVLKAANTSAGSSALRVGSTMFGEGLTETAQSIIERAAAGESIDLSEQQVFDEAIESFAAGMVGGSVFAATGQAIDYRKQRKEAKALNEKEGKEAEQSAEEQVDIVDSVQENSPESEKILEANRILEQNARDAEKLQKSKVLQEELSREAQLGVDALNEEADAEARDQALLVQAQERTVDDVLNIVRDRNIDIDSSQGATEGFSRLIFDATSRAKKAKGEKPVYRIEDATPNQVNSIYSAIENLPSQAELTSLPTISLSESISIASNEKKKLAGNKTKAQLESSVRPMVKKIIGKNAPDNIVDSASKAVVDNLISNGIINPVVLDAPTSKKKVAFIGEIDVYDSGQPAQAVFPGDRKPRKKKIKRYTLSEKADIESLLDSDFRSVSDAILSLAKANESTVKDSENSVRNVSGAYPSFKEAAEILTGLDRKTYNKSKKLHQDLGIVTEGRAPKIISREDSPVNRIAYEADQKSQTRWVIRNQDGGFVRAESSKKKSDKFIQGNQDKNLAEPQRERGFAVKEVQYREGATGQDTVSQSRVVDFIEDSPDFDAQIDAQRSARERTDALAESVTRYFGTTQSQAPNVTPQLLRAIEATRTKTKRGLKEATQAFREPALSLRKVFNSYAMAIEPGSPAFETVNESQNWSVPFDAASKRISSNVPVVVKEGEIIRTNGRGFGRQKLQVREGQISRNTPYSNYIEALNGFFDRIRTNPKVLDSPEITVFAEGPGRSVAIWNSPSFKEPMTIVMDYVEDGDAGDFYSVFDMFTGDNYGSEVENIQLKKSIPSKRGPNVSTQAVLAAEDPANAKPLAVGDKDAQGIAVSQIEIDADGLKVTEPKEKKGLLKYINNLFESTLGADRVAKIQRAAFDQWDSWVLAEQDLANKALGRVMFADQSAVSMARNIDNLFPMFNESLSKGFIKYADGVLSIERLGLDNETGDIQYYDPDSRTVKSGRFSSNMFNEENENTEGGFVTILSALQDANTNAVGSVFDYGRALRSYRILRENQSRPAKEKVRTPYDKNMDLLKEHLSIPFYNPKVAVAHHNIQKWNGNTVQFLVDTGVLDGEEAVFWLEHSDYIPFYLNLDHETNSLLEREWNSFQAKRGKEKRVYSPLTYNDPTKKLEKGSENLADPLESYLANAMGALTAGAVNVARSRAIRNAVANDTARRANRNDPTNPNVVKVREAGEDIFFEVDDAVELELSALVEADPLADVFSNDLAKKIFANPAKFLRETVTRDPGFALANLIRDSMIVWMLNPQMKGYLKGDVGIGLLPQAIKRSFNGSLNPQRQALQEAGMTSGPKSNTMLDSNYYVFDKNKKAADDIKQRVEGKKPTEGKFLAKPLTPVVAMWNALGELSNRSETATREIVYDHVFNTTRERLKKNSAREMLPDETTEEFENRITRIAQAEAVEQAREILNFNRRGSNPYIQKALSITPFANASMQGLNVMFRGMTGLRPVGIDREAGPDVVFNSLARRGARVAAASVALELLQIAAEDEDYEEQDDYIKDNYWLLPIGSGFFGIPKPFEYGFVFATMPQLLTRSIVDQFSGDLKDDQRSLFKSTLAAANMAIPSLPPALSLGKMYLTNRTAFGDIPIDYQYERDTGVKAEERVGPRTTAQAQLIGEVLGPLGRFVGVENLSPNYVDASVRALAGGLAMDAWNATDTLLRMPALVSSSYPYRVRPRPRLERLPVLDRFYYDNIGNADLSAFYDYRNEILNVERRLRRLQEQGRREQAAQVIEDNRDLLALSGASKRVYSDLKEIGAEIRRIESGEAEMGAFEGRERVTELELLRRQPLKYWKSLLARSRAN